MRFVFAVLLILTFVSCTKKSEKASAPATLTDNKPYENPCVKMAPAKFSELPEGKISQGHIIQLSPVLVCHMRYQSRTNVEEKLFYGEAGQPKLIYTPGPTNLGECGTTYKSMKPRMVKLKVEGSEHAVVVIEVLTIKAGCGTPDIVKSQITLYDLVAHKPSSPLTASNYGKKGTKYDFNWGRCEEEACDQVQFEKIEIGKKTKPAAFVLMWDKEFRLSERAH